MSSLLRRCLRAAWFTLLLLWCTTAVVDAATPTPPGTRTSVIAPTTTAPRGATPPAGATSIPGRASTAQTSPNATGGGDIALSTRVPPGTYITTYWSDPQPVSDKLTSWFPDVALDSAGTTHIVWNASEELAPTTSSNAVATASPNVRDYIMYRRFGSTPQPPATDIGLSHGGEAMRNAIIVDRDGTLDVLYRSGEHIWFIKAPISDATNFQAWSKPHIVSGNGTAYYAAITQDDTGTLHVVYSQNALVDVPQGSPEVLREGLFYRRSADGGATWSEPIRLSNSTSLHGNTRPQVWVQGTTVVVAWDEGYDNINAASDPTAGNIRRSLDSGQTWQPIQPIADVAGPIEQLTFAFGTEGQALLVWRVTTVNVVRYSMSFDGGETWGEAATVPNLVARPYYEKHQFDRYALATDRTGRLHLFVVGQDGSPDRLAVMHMELSDGFWSLPQIVFEGAGYPEYPGVATDGGNRLTMTFFVRDKIFDVGYYRVWRAEARIIGPGVNPAAIPSPAPTTRPRQLMPPAATSYTPGTLPGSIQADERPTIDHPLGVPPLGQSIFAAFGLAAAFAIGRIWWMKRR